MGTRDDFSLSTKRALALRAGHRCSFTGCTQITAGPSEEGPEAVNNVGKACHIHSAASGRGARRHKPEMTPEERRRIDNGVWMCATHADLIDKDEVAYTPEVLRQMKRDHDESIRLAQKSGKDRSLALQDLIALGPDLVFSGELLSFSDGEWELGFQHFVDGDISELARVAADFASVKPSDRYVVVNELGEGRMLAGAPTVDLKSRTIRCRVLPAADRIEAAALPRTWALSKDHDIFARNGTWAEVSGLDALPQQIETCLSHQQGESPFHRNFGARLAEYWRDFAGTIWFSRLLQLEAIRLASILYSDPLSGTSYTQFRCVERVHNVTALAEAPTNNWLPIRVDLTVRGLGRWTSDLSICVPQEVPNRPDILDRFTKPEAQTVTPDPVPEGSLPVGKGKWRVR